MGNLIGGIFSGIGDLATSINQISQGTPGRRPPLFEATPEPAYERALREYTARLLAQSATSIPPSFTQFTGSGGTATFNMGNTGLTPGEAIALREVGSKGQPTPFVQQGATQLTPDQLLFLASEPSGRVGDNPRVRREANQYKTLQSLEGQAQTPKRAKREANLQSKLSGTPFGSSS